jgi:hypothetical protein
MPELVSCLSAADTKAPGETPAQKFFKKYVDTVDSYGFNHGSGLRFYSKDVIFHNQNNAQYNGGDEMWAWMKQLFGQFQRLRHDFHTLWEIKNDDGTTTILSQWTRNIWLPGNTTEEPTVSIPLSWISRVGSAEYALLAQYLPKEAVVFQTQNVLQKE